jgi:hypothetical protein
MDVEKFRNNSPLDEEEVVFGSSNVVSTESSVKEAVERWEKELEAALGNGRTKKSVLRSISLNDNSSVSSSHSFGSDDIYEDEYLYDDHHDGNNSFEMEMNALAHSETLLTEELSRLDSLSPLSSHEEPMIPLRRPDPPTSDKSPEQFSSSTLGRPLLVRVDRQARISQLPQNSQAFVDSSRRHPLPDPEEQQESSSPGREEIFDRPPWLQPRSPSSTSSPPWRRPRRRSIRRSRCCRKITLVRIVGVVLSTAFVIAAVILPLYLRRTQQDLQLKTLHVVDFLIAHDISSREDLERYGSPQYRAAKWISEDQVRQQQHSWWPIGGWYSVFPDVLDRYIIAVLYFSLGGGEVWPEELNFMTPQHICTWNTKRQPLPSNGSDIIMPSSLGVHECQEDEFGTLVPTGIALGKQIS